MSEQRKAQLKGELNECYEQEEELKERKRSLLFLVSEEELNEFVWKWKQKIESPNCPIEEILKQMLKDMINRGENDSPR